MKNFTEDHSVFEHHAEEWWNEQGPFWTLHSINPLRIDFIKKFTGLINKNVLDVGCGGGILAESLAKEGATVHGIDISDEIIEIAINHAKTTGLNINYQASTIDSYSDNCQMLFDVITCMEMLEHVTDPLPVINTCKKLLKPDGHIFFSTINRNFKSFLQAIIGAELVLRLLPQGTHEYSKFIKPSELNAWCRKEELHIDQFTGIGYIPFINKFYLTHNIDVNYLAHAEIKKFND